MSRHPDAPRAALLAAGLLMAGAAAAQQAPPQTDRPIFQSGVHLVEVDVRVFDREGRFVPDLTRGDFEVLENGIPQQLQTLFLVGESTADANAEAGRKPRATSEARPLHGAQGRPFDGAQGKQTWIFVFDLNHLTPGAGFDRARRAVEDFVRDRFRDGDLAGVVAGSRMVNNRLSSVREELVSAVKSVKPLVETRNRQMELTREWPRLLNEDEATKIAREDRETVSRATMRACSDDPEQCRTADVQVREKARRIARETQRSTMETLTALNALASGLARVPGPKTIVFLTDGFVTEEVEATLRNVVGQTARAGGRVYSIDVRGLNRGRGAGIIDQGLATDEAGAPARFDVTEDGPNSLAVDTGGLMIRNENNIGRALDTIARDSGVYYVLGYQPSNTTFDGKFRPVEVRVKRRDVRLRARRGYLALEPARMLMPQPIAAPTAADPPAAPVITDRPPTVETSPDASAAVTSGAVAATPAAPVAGTVRLRPDVGRRIEELSKHEAGSASELATKGWEAYQRGDVESALVAFADAAAQPDVRPWVLYALGLSQAALGRAGDALASWERVRREVPEFEAVYIDLADTYAQLAELTKALQVLRDAEKRWPADPDIHNGIGVIHVRRGALDDAIAALTAASKVAPDDPLTHLNLARTYELRFVRGRRYVSSQRRWVADDDDRRKAKESYERCVQLGGPYAKQAAEAIARLEWSKD